MTAFYDDDHEQFRATVRRFVANEVLPHIERWNEAGIVDRELFAKAGTIGLLGMEIAEEHGGGGIADFRYNLVIAEEFARVGANSAGLGITLMNDILIPYFLGFTNTEQQARWLPGIASGDLITAIAMTEPGVGSDVASLATTAVRDGDDFIVNGAKTFITNGINADLVVTAVKTDPSARHRGVSLLVLERGMTGFERGRNLDKVGLHGQDTAELFFTDVRVPAANLIGEEGRGFYHLMANLPRERLSIGAYGVAAARRAIDLTVEYVKERQAFGQPVGAFQNSRFRLAECLTEVEVGAAFVRECVNELNAGTLSNERASMVKWWCTEMNWRIVDTCVQLHGGYGYMREFPIAQAFLDARVTTIYGGTTEIMKELIGRGMGL